MMKIQAEWLNRYRKYLSQFVEIDDDEWSEFSSRLILVSLQKKEYFLKPLESEIKIAFIIKGILRTYFISANANEYTTDFCSKDEISVNNRLSNSSNYEEYYCQAVVPSALLVLQSSDIAALEALSNKWGLLKSRIIEYYYPLKLEREKSLLSMSAEERYKQFLKKYSSIAEQIPQYQIASYLGITHIALSRLINSSIKPKNSIETSKS